MCAGNVFHQRTVILQYNIKMHHNVCLGNLGGGRAPSAKCNMVECVITAHLKAKQ
jgi:hypothetical protein